MKKTLIAAGVAGLAIASAAVLAGTLKNDDATGERIDAWSVKNLEKFGTSLAGTRESTIAAYTAGGQPEQQQLATRAFENIERLGASLEEMRSALSPAAADLASAIVERYREAQVQLMAFAMNRQNHEPSDELAQLESDGRREFEHETADFGEQLRVAIKKRRA